MSSVGSIFNLVPAEVLYDLVNATDAQYSFDFGYYAVNCSVKFTWKLEVGGKELMVSLSYQEYPQIFFSRLINRRLFGTPTTFATLRLGPGAMKRVR